MSLDIDPATPDAAFLAQFRIRDQLSPEVREHFDANALAWRFNLPHFETFRLAAEPIIAKAEADLARDGLTIGVGGYIHKCKEFLRMPSPDAWTACDGCGGTGNGADGESCPSCLGDGYHLHWFEGPEWSFD